MLIVAMMLAGAAAAADDLHAWARFSREPALAHTSETVEVATQGFEPGTTRPRYVMRLTRRRLGKVTGIGWAEAATCPAVAKTVAAMHDLLVPPIATPEDAGDIVIDGTGYSFEGSARGSNGHVAFSTNTGTPLAYWVDERLAALAPCWKPQKS